MIPTSLLFIHGASGHCNLEACETCTSVYIGFLYKGKVKNAIGGKNGKPQQRKKKMWGREGTWKREMGAVVWNAGFGFPSLRVKWRAIDSEDESRADRVAARGCAGTQREQNPNANKVIAGCRGWGDCQKWRLEANVSYKSKFKKTFQMISKCCLN